MSGEPYRFSFQANPTQYDFLRSEAKADLFACRMGEGKSAALCMACLYHTRRNPGATWAIIRDTWENLRDTTMKEFFRWFPDGVLGRYKASEKKFTWNAMGLRGEVMFLGMNDPADGAKLQSRALGAFGMDEPAPAAESGGIAEEIFDLAMTRLRQPGMHYYVAKLAENNPDESHWTYRRFAGDDPDEGFVLWQTRQPENLANLPSGYYDQMAITFKHRPDLKRRFVDGHFGFQRVGIPVTPQWDDGLHLAERLEPVAGRDLTLLWDFGLNPTCIITQVTPLQTWLVLDAFVGEEMGTYELITQFVKPTLAQRYPGFSLRHTGDPSGMQREQSSAQQSAVKVIRAELGGPWKSAPSRVDERLDPLQWVLSQHRQGRGMVQVDKQRARSVWYALRGGWHYNVSRGGQVGSISKNIHSHPGDCMGYGAAVLFPRMRVVERARKLRPEGPSFWRGSLFRPSRGLSRMPKHGEELR